MDITDRHILEDVFFHLQPDYVIHLAALARVQPSIKDPMKYHRHNVDGTLNVLWCSHKHGVKKVVLASSSSVYGEGDIPAKENQRLFPMSPYAYNKQIDEILADMFAYVYGLSTICFRFFNVYGKNMLQGQYGTVMTAFIDKVKKGEPLVIHNDGEQRRAFTYVGDIVNGLILGMKSEWIGNYNLGSSKNYSVNQIADLIAGKDHPRVYKTGIVEPFETLAGNSKAKRDLDWKPKGKLKKKIGEIWS